MTTATLKPSDVKRFYNANSNGHFFDRDTMKFFGDTMASFGVKAVAGQMYLYRQPSATVNVFGRRQRAGRQFFNAWLITTEHDLNHCDDETTQAVYDAI